MKCNQTETSYEQSPLKELENVNTQSERQMETKYNREFEELVKKHELN